MHEVFWTSHAKESFQQIVRFIEENWSEKEVQQLLSRTDSLIVRIKSFPFMFACSEYEDVRKGPIGKETSVFYSIQGDQIILLAFYDNRQNPEDFYLELEGIGSDEG